MEEEVKKEEILNEEIENLEDNLNEKEAPPIEKKKKDKKCKIDKEKEELMKSNLELKDKTLRLVAEMQNMKRRADIDLQNAYKYDGIDLIDKLLPVIDNFERALSLKQEGNEKFLEGFKMIYENLMMILKNKGVIEIDALDKSFDPSIMNAVATEVNNEKEENTVLEVLQKGYKYNDKIIRPAMVKVSQKDN